MSKPQASLEMVKDYAYELNVIPKGEVVPFDMLQVMKRQMDAALAVSQRHSPNASRDSAINDAVQDLRIVKHQIKELTQAAKNHQSAFNAAINFALDRAGPEGLTFLRTWREGDFDAIAREWPDFDLSSVAACETPSV